MLQVIFWNLVYILGILGAVIGIITAIGIFLIAIKLIRGH